MSIFISWRGSDREDKNKIVSQIRKELPNEIIWESDENCMTNFSEECMKAISQCEVFVCLLSEASMKMSYMLNEIIAGRTRENNGELNILVYKISDFEYTPEFSMQLNHIPDSNYLGRLYNDNSGIYTLINRIKKLLEKRRSGNPEKPFDVNVPIIDGITLGKNRYFVENSRDKELLQIDNCFKKSNIIVLNYMDGYGKKSVAKEYFQNNNIINKAFTFNMFEGSLKDFFISELKFTNVNKNIFEGLKDDKLILKKIEFLKKLDNDTLLVIPNVIFTNEDNDILDYLDDVKCRIIIITQIIPKYLNDKWPIINIKRMEDEKLKELFYHYYPSLSEDDKKTISKTLDEFIDNVDGHTKTIELTSKNLSEEINLNVNDIPNILLNINGSSNNDLSNRIFESISNMFDVRKFNDIEKSILLCGCYLCSVPINEKLFIECLNSIGINNVESLNKLIKLNWIDRDVQNKTVSMEKLLINVCFNKIKLNNNIEEICVEFIYDELENAYISGNLNDIKTSFKRLSLYVSLKQVKEFSNLIDLVVKELDYSNSEISNISYKDAINTLNIINEKLDYFFDNKKIEIIMSKLIDTLINELNFVKAISEYKNNETLSTTVINSIITTKEYSEYVEEVINDLSNNRIKEIINDLFFNILSGNKNIIINVLIACNELNRFINTEYVDDLLIANGILLSLLYNLIITNKSNKFVINSLSKKYIEINDDLETLIDDYESDETKLLIVTISYLENLLDFNENSIVLDNTYEDFIDLIDRNHNKVYKDLQSYYDVKSNLMSLYIRNKISNNDIDIANENIQSLFSIPTSSDIIYISKVYVVKDMFDKYLNNTEIEEAKEFISKYLTDDIINYESDLYDIKAIVDDLSSTKDTLLSPSLFDEFMDEANEYEDYYKAFQLEYNDKKSYEKYSEIARKAKIVNYENFQFEDIQKEVKKLKMQATMGMKWDVISPNAFALVSEAGYRILGYRHHLVQYIGGAMLLDGKIAEIYNGEGKTYTIILAAFVKYLYNKKVRIIDSNEYLVERNYKWMKGVLEYLGLKVGLIHPKIIVEPNDKIKEYDVIYEHIFAGMHHKLRSEFALNNQIKYDCAIIDEADLTIVENAPKQINLNSFKVDEEYKILCNNIHNIYLEMDSDPVKYWELKNGRVYLKKPTYDLVSKRMNINLESEKNTYLLQIEEIMIAAIEVYNLFKLNQNYYIIKNDIKVEDKKSGKLLDVRALYKYLIAKKEKLDYLCEVIKFNKEVVHNFITVYEYINSFDSICGTTATASSMEHEFKKLYNLDIVRVPTNIPIKRIDHKPLIYYNFEPKMKHIINMIEEKSSTGQPILMLSNSINESLIVSKMLKEKGIYHLLINGANINEEAHLFNESGMKGMITISTSISNRGVDIVLGGNYKENVKQILLKNGYSKEKIDKAVYGTTNTLDKNNIEYNELMEIKDKYNSLCAIYAKKSIEEREDILKLGGLCVIGTSCFEDLRIEQQMRGRAGRQGQPGESYVFYSFKDPNLQRLLGSSVNFVDKMMVSIGDEAFDSKLLNRTIERSRRIIQNRTYESVLNKENIIYFIEKRKMLKEFKQNLENKRITKNDLVDKYIVNNETVHNLIKEYIKTHEIYDVCLKGLIKYLPIDNFNIKDKLLPRIIQNAINNYIENEKDSVLNGDIIIQLYEFMIKSIWEEYIKKMNAQIDTYKNNQLINENKKKKILKKYSDDIFVNIFEEKIRLIIFAKVKHN